MAEQNPQFPKRAERHRRTRPTPESRNAGSAEPNTSLHESPSRLAPSPAALAAPAAVEPRNLQRHLDNAMNRAIFLANRARENGDVPVGAVIIDDNGNVIAQGWNTREAQHDPTGHAEIMAIRQAAQKLQSWRLSELTLVVTLEPCTMCAGAIVGARLKRLVFGAWDEKAGACGSTRDIVRDSRLNHQVEVRSGVLANECAIQLRGFFNQRRRR